MKNVEEVIALGGIERPVLRRTAHYDYWSDTVRRSVVDLADMLMFGNGGVRFGEVAHRHNLGRNIDPRFVMCVTLHYDLKRCGAGRRRLHRLDTPGKIRSIPHPYGGSAVRG